MTNITVKPLDDGSFEVSVQASAPTVHLVTVSAAYAEKLTSGKVSVPVLIRSCFDFLLERESNTSILRRFDLSVIGHYFPEFEQQIGQRLK